MAFYGLSNTLPVFIFLSSISPKYWDTLNSFPYICPKIEQIDFTYNLHLGLKTTGQVANSTASDKMS